MSNVKFTRSKSVGNDNDVVGRHVIESHEVIFDLFSQRDELGVLAILKIMPFKSKNIGVGKVDALLESPGRAAQTAARPGDSSNASTSPTPIFFDLNGIILRIANTPSSSR